MLSRTVRVAHPRFTRSIRVWGKRWETEVRDGKRMERKSEYVPGRGWVVERAEEEEYDGGSEIDLITLKRVPRVRGGWDPDVDRKKRDHEGKTEFLGGFLQESSPPAPPPQGAKSAIAPQKTSDLPSGVAAATPTYPDPEQAPPPLPPRPTPPPPPPPRDGPGSSSLESDSGSDSDSDMDIHLPSDVKSSAGHPPKSKYEIELERERRMRREAMILEWERLREEEEKEESAMKDIRAYRIMREQQEALSREVERKEVEKREAEEKEMQRREEERREELRLEDQRAIETEMEKERERALQEANVKAEKESLAPARENKEEWDWSGTDTPTAEDIYRTPQYPPTQKYFVLTRNPSTNDFNFAPLPLALSPISLEQTTPIKVLENMQSPEKFICYWGVVQRLGFEIVAGERECVIVRASIEDADEKMEGMLREIEGIQELQPKPALGDAVPPKGLDAIAADIAGKIGLGGKPSSVVEEPPKVFEEFSSLVGETSKPAEKEPEPVEQEIAKPIEEIVKSQEASPEAPGSTAPEEDFKFEPLEAEHSDQIAGGAKHTEVVKGEIEPGQAHREAVVTPSMKTAGEEPVEIETNNAWQDKYRFAENPEKTFQQPVEETLSTEAPKIVKGGPKAEAAGEWETTAAADPWAFTKEQTPTTQSPPPAETAPQPFLSPASEVARESWEKKRGSPPPLTPAEELLAKPAPEKPTHPAPAAAKAVNSQQQQQQQQQGKSKQGKKPKRKIFWTSVWVAAATGGTSLLLENYY
ncbi:unnamed protein product [Tuber aestivum]|uniref:Uncharacterized protein n=1 Tax=Tuber aestivum TaxID=59557 RepID=A0A292PRF0_9PEZI|nr:unnamed protein product [Tuber aestivum]